MFASRFVASVFFLATSAGLASAHSPVTCAAVLVSLAALPAEKAVAVRTAMPVASVALAEGLAWEYRLLLAKTRRSAEEDARLAVLSEGVDLFDAVEEYRRCLGSYEEAHRERLRATTTAVSGALRAAEKERYRATVQATEWLNLAWDLDADVLDRVLTPAEDPEVVEVEEEPISVPAREIRLHFRDKDLDTFFRSEDTFANPRAKAGKFAWQRYAKVILAHLVTLNDVRSIDELREIEGTVKRYYPTQKRFGFFAVEADKQFRILFRWDDKQERAYEVFVEDYHAE